MVSIIIPTYNRAGLISRAINSVHEQTYKLWELIIVDDGSIDNTEEQVKPFLADTRIRYLKKTNSGAAESRNFGVDLASYEWITFLDSDDEAKPNWLETFVSEIKKGSVIISCGLEKYNEDGKHTGTRLPKQNSNNTGGQFTNGGVYIIQKSLFTSLGGFDPKLKSGQHTELYFRIRKFASENTIETTIINEPLVKIHIHNGYRIRSDHHAKFEGSLYTYNKHYNDALKSKKLRSLFEGIIAYNAYKVKQRRTAIRFGFKSFFNRPGRKTFQRLVRYLLWIR
jgi:glycosyltransferase involved in cell wall biosynthesis